VATGTAPNALTTNLGGGPAVLVNEASNLGIGTTAPQAKLQVSGGAARFDGDQQILFTDQDTNNNLKVQLWSGYGLGINAGTLFSAANGRHSWRDASGANERMALTTTADGGLTVTGTGASSFAGNLGIGTTTPERSLHVDGTEVHSGGDAGGFSFADRGVDSFVQGPTQGQRWVWYATGGTARLWSGGDMVSVTPQGDLTVKGQLHQTSDARLKQRIRPLEGILDRLTEVRGVSYLPRTVGGRTGQLEEEEEEEEGPAIGVVARRSKRSSPSWWPRPQGRATKGSTTVGSPPCCWKR
jgi:hypothetical protein